MKYGTLFLLLGGVLLAGCAILQSTVLVILAVYAAAGFLALGSAYLLGSSRIWLKQSNGTISPLGYFLLGPLHILNWLSLLVTVRMNPEEPFHEIAPNVWLGRRLISGEATFFAEKPGCAVLDLTGEFAENPRLRNARYLCLPTLDHTAPTRAQIETAMKFIGDHAPGRTVFVHCALGHGRGATVAAAWLIKSGMASNVEQAESRLKGFRPGVRLKAGQLAVLRAMFPDKANS